MPLPCQSNGTVSGQPRSSRWANGRRASVSDATVKKFTIQIFFADYLVVLQYPIT